MRMVRGMNRFLGALIEVESLETETIVVRYSSESSGHLPIGDHRWMCLLPGKQYPRNNETKWRVANCTLELRGITETIS